MTVDEYLAFEETSEVRHEYIDGQIFTLVRTTLRHDLITNNLISILHSHLKGGRCRVFSSNVKLRIDAINRFYYPDLLVSCVPVDVTSVYVKTPVLVVEVLSPSTAAIDKREKLVAYRQVESLQEYVIVHQSKRRVEIYRKSTDGHWLTAEQIVEKGLLALNSLPGASLSIDLDDIYDGIPWGEEKSEEPWQVREAAEEYSLVVDQ
jgi:Uma2 family endonuclease